jgi:hypothetical protein
MKRIAAVMTLLGTLGVLSAQTFVNPVSEKWLATANDITILTMSGDSVQGKTSMVSVAGSRITKIGLKDAAGNKHKFEASDIKALRYKLTKLAKMEQIANTAIKSIENAINTNYAFLASQDIVVWENVKSEDGKDTYLLQVINPWFCNYIKVYSVPSMVTASFGNKKFDMPEEILTVKDGKTMEMKKRKYRSEGFSTLFGDCAAMMEKVVEKERDWDDFPEHVKMYEECKSGAAQ